MLNKDIQRNLLQQLIGSSVRYDKVESILQSYVIVPIVL